jgi:hypothetical protein
MKTMNHVAGVVLLVIIAMFGYAAVANSGPPDDPSQAGRYQLETGLYEFFTDGKPVDRPTVFLIDTATGDTWAMGGADTWIPLKNPRR